MDIVMMKRGRVGGLLFTRRGLAFLLSAGAALGVWSLVDHAAEAQGLDIEKVFWCDSAIGDLGGQTPEECLEARNLIFSNCSSCHTIVPIVKTQRTEEGWRATMAKHRPLVPDVSDSDFELVSAFLAAHYNPSNPVPELPPALENLGLDQAF